jgi:Putative zinc-finger
LSEEKPPLSDAIRHLAEQERRSLTEHPSPGELSAYHAGTLSSEAEARVREHLALCRHCGDLLLDLAGFADLAPPPGVPELTDAEVEEDWQALRARMGEGEPGRVLREEATKPPGEVVPIRRPSPAVPMKPDRDFSPWKVVAAAILVAVVGLSAWKLISQQPTSKQAGPLRSFDQGQTMRGAEPPLEHMSANQPAVFNFYPLENYARYEGRILQEREVVWETFDVEQTSLPSSKDKKVSFRIPGGSLESGRYRAVLYGLGQGSPEVAGEIGFDVDEP